MAKNYQGKRGHILALSSGINGQMQGPAVVVSMCMSDGAVKRAPAGF